MNYEVLKDFKKVSDVPQEIITEYEKNIPQDMIDLYKEYGFGSFFHDYFKVINSHDYEDVVKESYFDGAYAIPIMATAFGDIILYNTKEQIMVILLYRYMDLEVLGSYFFRNLVSQVYLDTKIKNKKYDKALEKYGPLEYEECFGYEPLLGLGGKENLKNIQKVRIREYIEINTQMVGKIE